MLTLKALFCSYTNPPVQTAREIAEQQIRQAEIEWLSVTMQAEELEASASCRRAEARMLATRIVRLENNLMNGIK